MLEYTTQEITHLVQPTHPRGTEIIFTGHYDLTKLYGHCWIPLGMDPGIPAALHDSVGHRAKIFQTASDKASGENEFTLSIWCFPGSVFLTTTASLHVQIECNTHKTVKFYTGWPKNSQIFPRESLLWTFQKILLGQGSQTLGPQTGLWPFRNQAAQQQVSGRQARLHLYLQLLPISHIISWALPPVRSVGALDSPRSRNPTMNNACEGSRFALLMRM